MKSKINLNLDNIKPFDFKFQKFLRGGGGRSIEEVFTFLIFEPLSYGV